MIGTVGRYNYYPWLDTAPMPCLYNIPFEDGGSYYRSKDRTTAVSRVKGGPLAPDLMGVVYFMEVPEGVEVYAEVTGLPDYQPGTDENLPIGPHGFHIHEFGNCDIGDPQNPFQAAGDHWNPENQPHGNHAGDFPVLFSNHGRAAMYFFTDKFKVADIIGKSVIIHQSPDDYRSQPSGNAGKRLACGIIK